MWPGWRARHDLSETVESILTPLDVEVEFRIPRASQKKGRAGEVRLPRSSGSVAVCTTADLRCWRGSPIKSRRRLITVADYLGLHGATVTATEGLVDQDAHPSSARLDSAETGSAAGGGWG
jgi:hypothetical protein